MEKYIRLFAYDHEQNMRLIKPCLEKKDFPSEGIRLLNHIIASKLLWLERVAKMPVKTQPWPEWSATILHEKALAGHNEWSVLLARMNEKDAEKIISFRDLKSVTHERPLRSVMEQVVIHGAHHRGQIAMNFRQNGFVPPKMDFIFSSFSG